VLLTNALDPYHKKFVIARVLYIMGYPFLCGVEIHIKQVLLQIVIEITGVIAILGKR
jgi:hypothetical protein